MLALLLHGVIIQLKVKSKPYQMVWRGLKTNMAIIAASMLAHCKNQKRQRKRCVMIFSQ